jgi:solute carrier family 25 thiamine pyrophosphate transporter 19
MHVPAQDDAADGKQNKAQRMALDATAGALAGAISRFMVGPLDVVKIRFQVQLEPISMQQTARTKLPSHYTGFVNAFKTIVAEEGIRVSAPESVQHPGQ